MPEAYPEHLFSGRRQRPSGRATLLVLLGTILCLLVLAAVPLSDAFSGATHRLQGVTVLRCHVLNGSFESEPVTFSAARVSTPVRQQLSSDLAKLIGVEETLSEQPTYQQPGDVERFLVLQEAVQRDRAQLLVLRLSGGGNRPKPAAHAGSAAPGLNRRCI